MTALTQRIFAEGVALIAQRWKDVPPPLALVMAQWLRAHGCTGEEFIAGVSRAVAEEEFSPSAKRILELGRPEVSAESRAGAVFDRVLACRSYHPVHGLRLSLDVVRATIGEAAARACVAVGVSRLNGLTDDVVPFVLRDFARAFAEFDHEQGDRATASYFVAIGSGSAPRVRSAEATPVSRITPGAVRSITDGNR